MQSVLAAVLVSVFFLAIAFTILTAFMSSAQTATSLPAPDTVPVSLSATQLLTCNQYSYYGTNDYTIAVPASYTDFFKLTMYSQLPAKIDTIMLDEAGTRQTIKPGISTHGGETVSWSTSLTPAQKLTLRVMPGDTVVVASATPKISSGVLFISSGTIIPNTLGTCPFNLPAKPPVVNGQALGVEGRGRACTAVSLASTFRDKILVVVSALPSQYVCSRDIPVFVSLMGNGDSVTVAEGADYRIRVYGAGGTRTLPFSNAIVIWYDSGTTIIKSTTYQTTVSKSLATPISLEIGAAKQCSQDGEVSGLFTLVAAFKSRYIYIAGLTPGDKIYVQAYTYTKTITANAPTVTIDVLSIPTNDLVSAIQNGGIMITIVPTKEHMKYLFPTGAWVHVRTPSSDAWYYVTTPLVVDCAEQIIVHSTARDYTATINTYKFTIWSLDFNGKNIGTFPKIIAGVEDGKVYLVSRYGVYTLSATPAGTPIIIDTGPGTYVVVREGPMIKKYDYVTSITIVGRRYGIIAYLGR